MASGIVIALTLIFLGHHITAPMGHRAQSLAVRAWKFFERTSHSCTDDAVREEHVKAALWDLRAKIYRHCIEFLVHVVGFAIIGMGYKLSVDPLSMFQLVQLCLMGCVYTAHHSVLSGRLQLNWTNLRGIYCVFYASFIIFVLVNLWQNETAARAVINQAFNVCSRMCLVHFSTFPAQSNTFFSSRQDCPLNAVLGHSSLHYFSCVNVDFSARV